MRLNRVRDVGEVLIQVSLLLLLVLVPLLSSTQVFATHTTLKVAALLPLSGLLLLAVGLARAAEVAADRIDAVALVLGIALSLSALLSPSPISAVFGPYNQSTGLLVLLAGILLFLSARRFSKEERDLSIGLVVLGSVIVALLMLAQQLGLGAVVEALGVPTTGRPQATLGNPIHAGIFTALGLVAAVGLLAGSRQSRVLQVLLALAMLVLAPALLLSFSRAAWLGALFGMVLVVWRFSFLHDRRPSNRFLAFAGALLLLLAVFGLVADPQVGGLSLRDRLSSSDQASEQSGSYRFGLYEVAVRGLIDRPVLGWGPGNYGIAWQKHVDQGMLEVHPDAWAVDSHSLFFELAATGGLVVLVAFLSFCAFLVVSWARLLRQPNAPASWLIALPAAALVGLFFSTQHPFLTPLLFLLTGLATVAPLAAVEGHSQEESPDQAPGSFPHWSSALIMVAGGVVLVVGCYAGVRMVSADALLLQGTVTGDYVRLERSVDKFPYYARPIVEKGLRLSRGASLGQQQVAVEVFHDALDVEPRNAYVLQVLAATLFDMGDTAGAMSRANEALEAFPLYADARLLRANILVAEGNEGEALDDVRQSLAIGTPTAQRFYLAAVITGQLDRAAARRIVDQGLERYPADARLLQLSKATE